MSRLPAVVVTCVLVCLAGCAGAAQPDGARPASAAATVAADPAMTADVTGLWGADPDTAQDRRLPWIRLDYDGRMAGFDGCNQVGGTWSLDPAARRVRGVELATTSVACARAVDASFDSMRLGADGLTYDVDGTTRTMAPSRRPPVAMYVLRDDSHLLEAVSAPYRPGSPTSDAASRTIAAVQALVDSDPHKDSTYGTLWGRSCAPGRSVRSVETEGGTATVTLAGRGGEVCDLTPEAQVKRRQQLAWTVVDGLGIDPSTTVRLVSRSGEPLWDDTVADPAVLAAR